MYIVQLQAYSSYKISTFCRIFPFVHSRHRLTFGRSNVHRSDVSNVQNEKFDKKYLAIMLVTQRSIY